MSVRKLLFTRLQAEGQIAVVLLLTVLAYCPFLGWFSDLACHFPLQYAVMLLVAVIIAVIKKRPFLWIALGLLGLVLNLSAVLPWYLGKAEETAESTARLRLMQINVKTENRRYQDVIEAVRNASPDVISLQEVDEKWMSRLQPLRKDYPYAIEALRDDHFGIALLSRIPFEEQRELEVQFKRVSLFGPYALPSLVANLKVGGVSVTILSTHPVPPVFPESMRARDEQLRAIGQVSSQLGENLIVVGDLNTTSHAPIYREFLELTGLRDSRHGFGWQPTWPTWVPILFIPLDHVLVSERFVVLQRRTGPYVGSDHLPVIVELGLRE